MISTSFSTPLPSPLSSPLSYPSTDKIVAVCKNCSYSFRPKTPNQEFCTKGKLLFF